VENLLAILEIDAIRVVQADRPAECAATGIILDRESIIDRALGTRVTGRTAEQPGLGVMGADFGGPFKLPARFFLTALDDDVGNLPRQAGDAEARGFDDFNPFDIGDPDPLELRDGAARLVGDALAVDQDVLRRLTKPAFLDGAAQGEAGHLD